MRKYLLLSTITLFALFEISCKQNKVKPIELKIQKKDTAFEVRGEYEKILLISITNKVGYDTTFNILNEYFNKFDYGTSYKIDSTLNDISNKYGITKKKVASMVFSFKYQQISVNEDYIEQNY